MNTFLRLLVEWGRMKYCNVPEKGENGTGKILGEGYPRDFLSLNYFLFLLSPSIQPQGITKQGKGLGAGENKEGGKFLFA